VTLFAQRAFVVGLGIAIAFFAANAGFLFLFAVYLQAGLGFSPIAAGLTYAPAAVGLLVMSLAAPKLIPLLGRRVLSVGYGIAALGYLATTAVVTAAGASVKPLELAPGLLIVGLGHGLGITPLMGTVLSGVAPRQAGAASGVLTTALQVGNVLGVAVFSLAFFAFLGTPARAGGQGGAYAGAFAASLPAAAALTLVAFVLVRLLPTARAETANVLVERAGGWAPGLAYSLFLASGGRIGERAFTEILGGVMDRRTRLTRQAPADPGDFLAYQFAAGAGDDAWRNFLTREALTRGDHEVAHEDERRPVIQLQVGEIRRRQAEGLIDPEFDPALVRLMAFALATYPRVFRQITRMTTGLEPDDPRFATAWSAFLRELGHRLAPGEIRTSAPGRDRTDPAAPSSHPPGA
jgi:MFS family permease